MAKRKVDQNGIPVKSRIWVRNEDGPMICCRNEGAKGSEATRIHCFALEDSWSLNKGEKSYRKFGTTPGGRPYEIYQVRKLDGSIYRKLEVWGEDGQHVKVRCLNGEKAKVLRKSIDSILNSVLRLGPQIQKSYTTPRVR